MHINIIIQSQREMHACNQMKWLIKKKYTSNALGCRNSSEDIKTNLSSTS